MPNIVVGDPQGVDSALFSTDYEYEYPDGLDLKPGSRLHNELKNKILQRARESRNVMQRRFSNWNDIDRTLTAYIDVDVAEEKVKTKDARKPVSVVFPYSYAMLETLLTYLAMAFFQDPVFRYEGVSPEDTIGAIMLELTIGLHCNKTKVPLNLHTQFRDSLAYGMGVTVPGWEVRRGKRTVKKSGFLYSALGKILRTQSMKTSVDRVLFEGNKLDNVDPYRYLPDPNVGVHEVQKGEFVGWVIGDNYMDMLTTERDDDSMFNVKYIKHIKNKRSIYSSEDSERERRYGGPLVEKAFATTHKVDNIYMFVKIIPKDWKVGPGERPEKWLFGLCNDSIIFKATPTHMDHGLFPVAVAAPDFDGYSSTPMARLEVMYGLQHTLDWLFNSHIANVRKAINDMLVVDPYLVNINDLKDPAPGKLIRLRRPAWGRGVEKVVQQLNVNDITRANISDSVYITQWMEKIAAADASAMGALRQGGPERLTKAEFQGTKGASISRLERIAKVIGIQSMQDIGYMFASHAQQMMDEEHYVKVTGRWRETLLREYGVQGNSMKVSPLDILIDYDVMVRDGSIPGGNFSQTWVNLYKVIASTPELIKELDTVRIFMHIARGLGAKNVEDFRRNTGMIQPVVKPDELVSREVERGNLVSAEGV